MEQVAWLFLGVIAAGASYLTLFRGFSDILGGIIGGLAWSLWSFGATNIELYRSSCGLGPERVSYPSLALLGAGLALVMFLVMLAGSVKVLDVRGESLTEES